MTPSDFDLPEGIIYYFEGPEAQPSAFLSICCSVITSHCTGSGLHVGRFEGHSERLVAVTGPPGSLDRFLSAMDRYERLLTGSLELPEDVVRPYGQTTHDGRLAGDDPARYEGLKRAIVGGELTLAESGGDGFPLALYQVPPPIQKHGPNAPRAEITSDRVITSEVVTQVEQPVAKTHKYQERVIGPRKWYQLKRVQTVERERTIVSWHPVPRTIHRRVEIRTYRPRRMFDRVPGLTFAAIPPGRFSMTLPDPQWTHGTREGRTVTVELTHSFEIQCVPVPQVLYVRLAGRNPSEHKGDILPVEQVSWFDACRVCNRLSELMHLEPAYAFDGDTVIWGGPENRGWRLPTEAEWEYACRAGDEYAPSDRLDALAWYRDNSGGTTHPIMEKPANAWGIHDMLGNVDEWCWDWHNDNYPRGPTVNPTGPVEGTLRVLRGGSFQDEPWFVQPGRHGRGHDPREGAPWIGFRMARTIG